VTEFSVLERLGSGALLELKPHTGRTHQIRVHLASCGYPILCDVLYGREMEYPDGAPVLRRQALHAAGLQFAHPASGERCAFESPMPADMRGALEALRVAATGLRRR
jgi:23S rRNA-/tRNA-specific pseudouridylate synthase